MPTSCSQLDDLFQGISSTLDGYLSVLENPCVPVSCVSWVSSYVSGDTLHVDIFRCASSQPGFFGLRDSGAQLVLVLVRSLPSVTVCARQA